MSRIRIFSFLTASFFIAMTAPAVAEDRADDGPPVDVDHGVKIPMRDRVQLHATVYRLHGQKERLPVIVVLTPYVGDSVHDTAMYFAQHGYVFAAVDSRGRNSRGSRLRLVLGAINEIAVQKNYNSGGVVADETAKSARTAHVFLHHDAAHPSAIELPFLLPALPARANDHSPAMKPQP